MKKNMLHDCGLQNKKLFSRVGTKMYYKICNNICRLKVIFFCFVTGIRNWHHFCTDVDRQPSAIQQLYEDPDSKQQHGGNDLGPWHHLQKLQERRLALDYDAQSASAYLEWWEDIIHAEVKINGFSLSDITDIVFLNSRLSFHLCSEFTTQQTLGFPFQGKINRQYKWKQCHYYPSLYWRSHLEYSNFLRTQVEFNTV